MNDLVSRAAAALEVKRRRIERMTRFGIVDNNKELIKVIHDDGSGEFAVINERPDILVPAALERVVTSKCPVICLYGGRGGGKTFTVAMILAAKAKDYEKKTLVCREHLSNIADSIHSEISSSIDQLGWGSVFKVTENTIYCRDSVSFRFKGINKDPAAVKSASQFDIAAVEEAQTIKKQSLQDLMPTIRKEGSQVIFMMNPQSSSGAVAERYIKRFQKKLDATGSYEDDRHLIIKVNYDSNPFFTKELREKMIDDREFMPPNEFRHVWLGEFNDSVNDALIASEWFDACIDAHEKLGVTISGKKVASFDPSDEGADAKGFAFMHGALLECIDQKLDGDAAQGVDWAAAKSRQYNAQAFVWDCDGLGVSLKREVERSLGGLEHVMFKGGSGVDNPTHSYGRGELRTTNKDTFRNKRAQYYVTLRDRMYATYLAVTRGCDISDNDIFSISSKCGDIDTLRAEMCGIPLKSNDTGKLQLMSKPDMRRLGISSPNMADAVMMALAGMHESVKAEKINFASLW